MRGHSMSVCKKITAGLLTAVVIAAGIFTAPTRVKAEEAQEAKVIYDNTTYKMKDYWSDTEKKAPIKAGYVFGGWYADEGKTPLTEKTAASYLETAYAKFVPAYVLSVKAQNEVGVAEGDGKKAAIRIVSSVDSKQYKNIGITLLLNNKNDKSPDPTTQVYSGLEATKDGVTKVCTAKQLFGEASEFVSGWRIYNIADQNDSKIIYVRPYWTTLDGTKVEGLAKYVHVEDGYKKLVSVPINILSKETAAAGVLQVICTDDRFEFYDVEGRFEAGKLFEDMEYNAVDSKNVKLVGNVATVDEAATVDGLYANIRFQLKNGANYESGTGDFTTFTVTGEDFCDWNEKDVVIDAWDVRY